MGSESEKSLIQFALHQRGFSDKRIEEISSTLHQIEDFKVFDFEKDLILDQKEKVINFKESQIKKLQEIQKTLYSSNDVRESWIKYFAHSFVLRQDTNISAISLEDLEMNPIMIRAFNLDTPKKLLDFFVGALFYRSVVTSMGNFLESMLSHGHDGVRSGKTKEWYDVVKEKEGITYPIQVKSGPNNIDKDQMKEAFNEKFNRDENETFKPKLGWLYGSRERGSMSFTHAKQYLDKWEERLLIGPELWNFVADEENFHKKVIRWVAEVGDSIGTEIPIHKEIEKVVTNLLPKFIEKYGDGKDGVSKYIDEIF